MHADRSGCVARPLRPLGSRVSYSVHFAVDLASVPDAARSEIIRTLQEIAEAVSTVPPASVFWSSMDDSLLQVDVEGWRVVYRILPRYQEVQVIELERIRL
jgi:hypothetical protein